MPPSVVHNINDPLVSVVIPCYNHGQYLDKAIKSVKSQTYKNIEIVVVDDGSTDNTKTITNKYPDVKYVYQLNQGLPATRNTGINSSKGDYILFLDADDWLYPKGVELNIYYLRQQSDCAFVSGTFDAVYVDENAIREGAVEVNNEHYCRLLECNYIGMIATVLFQRWVFVEFSYDTSLKNCEDYDLYLNIARKYPIYHHQNKIAAYRIHTANMSADIPKMLAGVLKVHQRQENNLKTEKEVQAFNKGITIWKHYYSKELYKSLLKSKVLASKAETSMLLSIKPSYYIKSTIKFNNTVIKSKIKKAMPAFSLRWLNKMGVYNHYVPAIGKVTSGDFNRISPFSKQFGYDRGGPVDRYYIEQFLAKQASSIYGRVLEIGDNEYTLQFGGNRLEKSDILHVDASNPNATFIGDISNAPHIPDNIFDCIILTQTLHLIYDFKEALKTCYRILKPGGTLLLTVPGITPIDQGEWNSTWYWSFTDKAMKKLIAETFANNSNEINSYGNVFTATSFLYGMGLQEVPIEKLNIHDPCYQVIISVKAIKAHK